jgi:hypothetical protein
MIEFICGCIIGGSLTFMVAVMFMASRKPRLVARKGQQVEYTNNKGTVLTYQLVINLYNDDEYTILKAHTQQLEFVAKVEKVQVL